MRARTYEILPLFAIRPAGGVFETLDSLATPATVLAARRAVALERELTDAATAALAVPRGSTEHLPPRIVDRMRRAVKQARELPEGEATTLPEFRRYAEAHGRLAAAIQAVEKPLLDELDRARASLRQSVAALLPPFLVFKSGAPIDLAQGSGATPAEGQSRTSKERNQEQHFLLYLQRLCAKNDTISEYGPSGWGTIRAGRGLTLAPRPGVAKRESYLERWVVAAVCEALSSDPEVRLEISPRVHPFCRWDGDVLIREDTQTVVELDARERELMLGCDGRTPAHALGATTLLDGLVEKGCVLWRVEPAPLDAHRIDRLLDEVGTWRRTPAIERWQAELRGLAALPGQFAASTQVERRRELMVDARVRLQAMGARLPAQGQRVLYAATNPIGEDCFRECGFSIGAESVEALVEDATPWFDLWRDTYSFVGARVDAGLHQLFTRMPRRREHVSLPAFLRYCKDQDAPLLQDSIPRLSREAFAEVRVAFEEATRSRATTEELELQVSDCHVVRNRFPLASRAAFTHPSADLQIAAESLEAVEAGNFQWVIAELHFASVVLQHLFYWSCPDQDALIAGFDRICGDDPFCVFDARILDQTSHTTAHVLDSHRGSYAGPDRPRPEWSSLAPALAEVFLDSEGVLAIRNGVTGQRLGPLSLFGLSSLGMHPFLFPLGRRTPRMRIGKVVVQRRSWVIGLDELEGGPFQGRSPALVIGVERLRTRLDLPRHVYIRPSNSSLVRAVARDKRDKDVKPVYVDLESYPFMELFNAWLRKHDELEVTEMLPRADQLLWREADGRRCFELRTLIVPAQTWGGGLHG